jgi:hypothetical protein
MAAPAFSVPFQDVALAAATAKTVAGIKPAANKPVTVTAVVVTFDGTDSTKTPVLIEIVSGTDASNSPGTNSTSVTPLQLRGRVSTAQTAAAKNWTTEPTVLTQLEPLRVSPTAGTIIQLPLGREIECDATNLKFLGLRLTAGAAVNVTGWLEFEE